ncbi:hypothetical protein [Mycobacterium shigaense]|uniref:hypothetical protein n=1 Tax=Mycobacterium shigaense TaxID=722731 RepID=UPI001E628445|nr:hypothetical protein [Mycobacterium shigaense]
MFGQQRGREIGALDLEAGLLWFGEAVAALSGGASSLTFGGTRQGDPVGIKVAPPGVEPVAAPDVLRQARILKALGASRVPVPAVVWQDRGDPSDTPPLFVMSHTDSEAHALDGALTEVPAPFLLHAVGAADDHDATRRVAEALGAVETAAQVTDAGRAAPSLRDGQSEAGAAWSSPELVGLRNIRAALDPDRVLKCQRHPAF